MTDNKKSSATAMSDNEIIKALECCAGDDGCDVCPMYKPTSKCITELQGKALDLINRQKAEIDALRKTILDADYSSITALKAKESWHMENSIYIYQLNERIERLQAHNSSMQSTLAKMSMGVEEAKAEAIKEFAEMIKDRYPNKYVVWGGGAYGITFENFIDNLVKEMTEPSLLDKKFGGDAE